MKPRRHGRVGLLLCLTASLWGCKQAPPADSRPAALDGDASAPPELVASLALRHPRQVLSRLTSQLQRIGVAPTADHDLLAALMRRAGLTTAVKDAIDLDGTLRFFFLDQERLHERQPLVALLPLRSAAALEAALRLGFAPADKEQPAGLRLFVPRPGNQAGPILFRIEGREVVIPSSRQSERKMAPFIRGRHARSSPSHDVTLDLHLDHLTPRQRGALDAALRRFGRHASRPRVESAVRHWVRQASRLLAGTAQLSVTADVDATGLALGLRARPQANGALADALSRLRPGAPFGLALLPSRPALVWSAHGPSLLQGGALLDAAIEILAREMPAGRRARLAATVARVRRGLGEAMTIGLFRPRPKRWALDCLAQADDAATVREALQEASGQVIAWERERAAARTSAGTVMQPFSHAGARGVTFSFEVAEAPNEDAQAGRAAADLSAGWAVKDRLVVFVVGAFAASELRRIIDRASDATRARALSPPLEALRRLGARAGAVLVSPRELVGLLAHHGVPRLRALATALAGNEPAVAPVFSWGLDKARTRLELDLLLPLDQLALLRHHVGGLLPARPAR